MKKTINIFMTTLSLFTCSSYSTMVVGTISSQVTTNNNTTYSPLAYASDKQTYTTNGATFIYPIGLFSLAPIVQASANPITAHPTTETYVVEINSNSSTSTTIMAYKIDSTGVSEAPNGSVDIYLLAIEQKV